MLAANSLIVKEDSPYVEFFYSSLQPYTHYLPLASNLGNLESQIEWASTHSEHVLRMIDNANAFANEHMTDERVTRFMRRTLSEYAKLMRYDVSVSNECVHVKIDCAA